MRRFRLMIGKITRIRGDCQVYLLPVDFEGEEIGSWETSPSDQFLRVKETLYRVSDGRLVVYVVREYYFHVEPSTYQLIQVQPEDLGRGGGFEMLGRACGRIPPDEAPAAQCCQAAGPWD